MKVVRPGTLILALLVGSLAISAPALGAAGSMRLVEERGVIAVDDEVEDALVVEGRLEVRGVVRGHLYAFDSDVFLRSTAVVLGSVTAIGGAIHLQEGAVLPASVDLEGAEYFGPNSGALRSGGSIRVASGATAVRLRPVSSSTLTSALMRAVLPFDRFAPPADLPVSALEGWSLGLGLEPTRPTEDTEAARSDGASRPEESLVIGGIIRLRVVSDRVQGTLQRGFRGVRGDARVTAIRLSSPKSADELFHRIASTPLEGRPRVSIKSGLGEGQHWFFRSRGRYTMVWQKGPWLLAVESRLAGPTRATDSEATIPQQQLFNQQVLESLRARMPRRDLQEIKR